MLVFVQSSMNDETQYRENIKTGWMRYLFNVYTSLSANISCNLISHFVPVISQAEKISSQYL